MFPPIQDDNWSHPPPRTGLPSFIDMVVRHIPTPKDGPGEFGLLYLGIGPLYICFLGMNIMLEYVEKYVGYIDFFTAMFMFTRDCFDPCARFFPEVNQQSLGFHLALSKQDWTYCAQWLTLKVTIRSCHSALKYAKDVRRRTGSWFRRRMILVILLMF